ncbi:hypothetical protein KFZ70_07685 [Tamlana fucoidanivorans]|uniref:Prenyltransferase n=1 Tax=Allotamlana fucoidanivorans TaxID=2583814 RepID=A0A5C4SJ49_9FLAO|nr:hypothetical protein [Tamlana fucoidanivorans]TNJ43792.1 hypothetical protein FGF67_10510 [Tamlana fucoidanivorans]
MRLFKPLFNFYINSSLHVALAVYALTWLTLLELELGYNEIILYFVFYATITGYNFVKFFGVAKFRHKKLTGWLKAIQIMSFFCFLLMCYYGAQLEQETLVILLVFAMLTFMYAIPFLPQRKDWTLRHVGGLKVYVIALVWAGVTVGLPAVNTRCEMTFNVLLLLVQRFIYVVVLMIPFEIRDLKFDNSKLETIPQKLGVNKAKTLGYGLLFLFFGLEFLKHNVNNTKMVLFIVVMLTGIMLRYAKIDQGKYYSAFMVESMPIMWLLFVFLFG